MSMDRKLPNLHRRTTTNRCGVTEMRRGATPKDANSPRTDAKHLQVGDTGQPQSSTNCNTWLASGTDLAVNTLSVDISSVV